MQSKSTDMNEGSEKIVKEECIIGKINTELKDPHTLNKVKCYHLRKKKMSIGNYTENDKEENNESDSDFNEDDSVNSEDGEQEDDSGKEDAKNKDVSMKLSSDSISDEEIKEINQEINELQKENIEAEKSQYAFFKQSLSDHDKQIYLNKNQ